jgi:hypothetical protein
MSGQATRRPAHPAHRAWHAALPYPFLRQGADLSARNSTSDAGQTGGEGSPATVRAYADVVLHEPEE